MGTMTEEQWKAEQRRLSAAVTRKRNQAKRPGTLATKLALKEEVKVVETALRAHKLNYYVLTGA
ncbi:hypothetical protein [Duganella vulcania]|uniref:Uncharacterized protein n=1 Tax=Duganella vulcania TaxID=2692166 RepID=A0A845GGL4_9BURK|nr:hypothetical protein [Duganella vulcania]MYM92650.1 hypothetical protein [Duganella vulcania]